MESSNNKAVILATIGGACLLLGSIIASNWVTVPADTDQTRESQPSPDMDRQTFSMDSAEIAPGSTTEWQRSILDSGPERRNITTNESSATSTRRDPSATLTGRFGMSLVEESLLTQQEGRSAEDVDAAIDRMVAEVLAETREDEYTVDDLQIVSTTDDSIRAYLNQASETIGEYGTHDLPDEITLFERAVRSSDESAYAQLEQIAGAYGQLRDAYLSIPVPTRYYRTHLNMVNVFNVLHTGILDMTAAESDPLRAYVRLQRYPDDIDGLNYALISMGMQVYENQELFSTNAEAAYFLTYLPNLNSN